MAVRLSQYLIRDGHTPLGEQYFNPIWGDLDRRLDGLERLVISWETAVTELQTNGLTRLNEVLTPLIVAAQAQLVSLIESAQNLTNLVTATQIDYWRPSIAGEIGYDDNGRIATISETLPDDNIRLISYTYNPNGLVATETVAIGANSQVTSYSYDDNGLLQEWSVEVIEP